MKFKGLAVAAMAFALIAGNAPKAEANDNGLFGAVIGAATGGFLGSNIGSGKGQLAATAAGTLIGSSMAQASDYDPYGSNYRVHYLQPRPVYVAPEPRRKVVIHKHKVIVKHVGPGKNKRAKQWRKRENEKFRRRLAEACYEQPRRCAKAF